MIDHCLVFISIKLLTYLLMIIVFFNRLCFENMNQKYMKIMTENFKAICVFEQKLQPNWSRDGLCIKKNVEI